jgi:hypothetical protein
MDAEIRREIGDPEKTHPKAVVYFVRAYMLHWYLMALQAKSTLSATPHQVGLNISQVRAFSHDKIGLLSPSEPP